MYKLILMGAVVGATIFVDGIVLAQTTGEPAPQDEPETINTSEPKQSTQYNRERDDSTEKTASEMDATAVEDGEQPAAATPPATEPAQNTPADSENSAAASKSATVKTSETPSSDASSTRDPMFTRTEAVDARFVESNVISIADRSGFKWQSKRGDFLFHPFVLVQSRFNLEVVDDEGLNLADPDNVVDLGFGIPAALLGIAGKAFDRLSFNLTLNGACAGKACLLNQAWLEGNVSDAFRIRLGKFKTPMHWTNQVRIGQTLTPTKPTSLSTPVNVPFDINAANPAFQTGFDLGLMAHGLVGNVFGYQVGIFNGEGIGVNMPKSTLSDDSNIPALLYAARLAVTPFGAMPLREGGPSLDENTKLLLAASVSYNVEANAESSNDFRGGVELGLASGGLYWGTEAYWMHLNFVERLEDSPSYLFFGAYSQLGYLFDIGIEPLVRMELFDRNSVDVDGILLMPAAGINYYMFGQNLKLQALYQYLARAGHADDFQRNDDDNGMSEHTFVLQVQFVL